MAQRRAILNQNRNNVNQLSHFAESRACRGVYFPAFPNATVINVRDENRSRFGLSEFAKVSRTRNENSMTIIERNTD